MYMSSDIYALPWKKIAEGWAKFGIGNHPSPSNLEAYERFMMSGIEDVEKPEILLLGSTPSIRDFVARRPVIHITILDINAHMIEAMVSFMKEKPVNETWEVGDWLDAKLPEKWFDVVFGDHVKANISAADYDIFFQHIRDLLKPTGYFVTRLITRFPDTPIYDPHELIEKYALIKPSKQSLTDFWNLLLFHTHDEEVSATDRMYDLLEQYTAEPYIKEYTKQLLEIIPKGKEWSVGRPWEEEKKTIEKYFEIVDKVQDDTVFRDSAFVYKMKPRIQV